MEGGLRRYRKKSVFLGHIKTNWGGQNEKGQKKPVCVTCAPVHEKDLKQIVLR